MSQLKDEIPEFGSLAFWKQFQTAGMNAWAKAMSEAVVSEEFAKTMGRYLEGYMEAVIPQQQLIKQAMEQQLQQMNVPSRPEILTLAERLTHLEMRVDDLDAKMDEILDRLEAIQATLSASQIVGGVNGFSSSQAGPKQ